MSDEYATNTFRRPIDWIEISIGVFLHVAAAIILGFVILGWCNI